MAEKAKTPSKNVTSSKSTPASNTVKESSKSKNRAFKVISLVVIIVLLILLLAYLTRGIFVAATVNGETITRIAVVKSLEKQSGAQVLEGMITKKLILQEAERRNITITQADIDKEINTISESLKKQGTTLDKALAGQGMTREELNGEIRIQLALRKMTESDIKISDKEIEQFITTNKEQFQEGTTDKQMRDLALTQLKQQRASEKTQTLIADLQKKAKIIHFAGY